MKKILRFENSPKIAKITKKMDPTVSDKQDILLKKDSKDKLLSTKKGKYTQRQTNEDSDPDEARKANPA